MKTTATLEHLRAIRTEVAKLAHWMEVMSAELRKMKTLVGAE